MPVGIRKLLSTLDVQRLRGVMPTVVALLAFASIVCGFAMIYAPLGWIVGGGLVLVDIIHGRMQQRGGNDT